MASKPVVGKKVDKLYSIPGKVPNPINMPNYCYFKDRCEMCVGGLRGRLSHEIRLSPTHTVSCYRYYDKKEGGKRNVTQQRDCRRRPAATRPRPRRSSSRSRRVRRSV